MADVTTRTADAEDGPGVAAGEAEAVSRPGVAFALLGAVQVVLIMAITVIVVALPAIQRDLGLGRTDLALLAAAYGLAFGGLLLLGGRLADLLGRRRMLRLGLAIFGSASVAAAVAPGFGVLLGTRFGQGVGAALAAPAAMALLGSVFPDPARRARALAAWGGLGSIGATAGTLLSGVVATWATWRWTFAPPAVVAVVVGAAAPRLVPAGPRPARVRLDVPGAVLVTGGMSTLSYGLLTAADRPWSSTAVLVPLVGGAVLLTGFAVVESRTRAPLIPLRFLVSARRVTALLAVLVAAGGMASSFFFLSLYFQQIRGLSPMWTSAAFLPYSVVQLAVGFLVGRLVGRAGSRTVTVAGLATAAGGLLLLSRMTVHTPYAGSLLAGLLVLALGIGMTLGGATVAAVDDVPAGRAGLAAGLVNTAIEAGPTVGLALLVSLAGAHTARLAAGSAPAAATTGGYAFALGAAGVFLVLVAGLGAATLRIRHTTSGSGSRTVLGMPDHPPTKERS